MIIAMLALIQLMPCFRKKKVSLFLGMKKLVVIKLAVLMDAAL